MRTFNFLPNERHQIAMDVPGPTFWIENGKPFDVDPALTLTEIEAGVFHGAWTEGEYTHERTFRVRTEAR